MEDAIRQPGLAKSVQRYQLEVDEAKVRLNLAVSPGAWLMPASLIINTESTVGYINKLKQAVAGMKLSVNNEVNSGTKKAALKLMAGGPSNINQPNSHSSNLIHKAAIGKPQQEKEEPTSDQGLQKLDPVQSDHETNKTIFEQNVGELSQGDLKQLIARLKEIKFSHYATNRERIFTSLCHQII